MLSAILSVPSVSTSIMDEWELEAALAVLLILGDNFESGLDTLFSLSVSVVETVARERTLDATDVRLAVETTLRATLRTDAAEEVTC